MNEAYPYNLERFVAAQALVYPRVEEELRTGGKRSHWMWFIFPQITGLGSSEMSRRFAISGREEAAAYLRHPLLGQRLRTCTELVNVIAEHKPVQIEEIFGHPDDRKFHSSMTLFAIAAQSEDQVFRVALARYFAGTEDESTLTQLATP